MCGTQRRLSCCVANCMTFLRLFAHCGLRCKIGSIKKRRCDASPPAKLTYIVFQQLLCSFIMAYNCLQVVTIGKHIARPCNEPCNAVSSGPKGCASGESGCASVVGCSPKLNGMRCGSKHDTLLDIHAKASHKICDQTRLYRKIQAFLSQNLKKKI